VNITDLFSPYTSLSRRIRLSVAGQQTGDTVIGQDGKGKYLRVEIIDLPLSSSSASSAGLTSVGLTISNPAALSVSNSPLTANGNLALTWNGASNQVVLGDGSLGTMTSGVASVNSGTNINVDNTDPANPIINSLSDRYKTTSVTSNSVSNGSKSFTVDLNLSYITLQEVLVVYNVSNHMHGEVTSYNPATGALVVDIKHHTGSGTYTSWSINLDGTPVDAITGNGVANRLAYFTAAQVIDDLDTATYPSLTELSYVKGVTSSIQNQINSISDNNDYLLVYSFKSTYNY
jgi:hypothetical protein